MSIRHSRRRASLGLTLIELIMFILIVSVALVGVMSVLNLTVFHSADPMVNKQLLAIAESLLEEVEMQPFTYCDPADANVTTATGATTVGSTINCSTWVQGLGQPNGETRGGAVPFNNVGDYYNGGPFTINPVTDINGGQTYAGYSATITLTAQALNGIASNSVTPNNINVILIGVRVQDTRGNSITLEGYRTRYAPNQP